jgi:HD-like signal output (HDOD) protein
MRTKILEQLEEKGDLPVLPDILIKLQSLLSDPGTGVIDVVRLIELEPTLAGNILQISNNAYYKTGYEQITTLLMAVNKLGLDKIKQIAFSLEITKLFSKTRGIDMAQFWKHGLAVANLTQIMAVYANLPLNVSNAYLSGLMHDCGITVFSYLIPEEYTSFLNHAGVEPIPLEKQETDRFGIDHQELGARFIEKWWQLDQEIIEAVRHHHSPDLNRPDKNQGCLPVYLANKLSITHGHTNGVQCMLPPFDAAELDILELTPDDVVRMTDDVKTAIAQSINLLENS